MGFGWLAPGSDRPAGGVTGVPVQGSINRPRGRIGHSSHQGQVGASDLATLQRGSQCLVGRGVWATSSTPDVSASSRWTSPARPGSRPRPAPGMPPAVRQPGCCAFSRRPGAPPPLGACPPPRGGRRSGRPRKRLPPAPGQAPRGARRARCLLPLQPLVRGEPATVDPGPPCSTSRRATDRLTPASPPPPCRPAPRRGRRGRSRSPPSERCEEEHGHPHRY